MTRRLVFLLVVTTLSVGGIACSEQAAAPAYVAVEVTDETTSGHHEHTVRQFSFDPPNSWQVSCEGCTSEFSRDVILIGKRAWQLVGGKWQPGDVEELQFPSLAVHSLVVTHLDMEQLGSVTPGPGMGGEETEVATITYDDYATYLVQVSHDESVREGIRERYQDARAFVTYTVGTKTHRLYEMHRTIDGPTIHSESVTTIQYDMGVVIEAPE